MTRKAEQNRAATEANLVKAAVSEFWCRSDEAAHQCVPESSPEGEKLRDAFTKKEWKRAETWLKAHAGNLRTVSVGPYVASFPAGGAVRGFVVSLVGGEDDHDDDFQFLYCPAGAEEERHGR